MAEARSYRFGPLEKRGFLAGLRLGQVLILAGAVLVALLIVNAIRSPMAIGPVGMVATAALAIAFVPLGHRTAEQWLPIGAGFVWRGFRGRNRYLSLAPIMGHTAGEVPCAVPPSLEGVSILEVTDASKLPQDVPCWIGVIKDEKAGTYTGVVQVKGRSFALLDEVEQGRVVEAWAGILAGYGRERSPVRRLQWLERTVSDSGEGVARYLGQERQLPLDSEAVRAYLGLLAEARPSTQRHEIYLALQIDRMRAGKMAKQLGDQDLGAYVVLVRELQGLADQLQAAELIVDGGLTPRHLAEVIRFAYDPAARDRQVVRNAVALPEERGLHPSSAWPVVTETSWSSYRTPSALHAVYWIGEWPRTNVGPSFMAPLMLQTKCARTVSVVMEPVPPLRAQREVEAARIADVSDEEMRKRAGFMSSFRRQREQEQVAIREQELADGHSDIRFSGYVTVTATGEDELEQACAEIEQQAGQARLELVRLDGDQEAGFTYTLPLARGLR
jgi:hypothetical protein